ncbi:MAG: head maturation protease, ClpP-related, partial [Pseudomonadota bacterium]
DDDDLFVGGELLLSGFVGDDYWGAGFTYAQVVRALANASGPLTVRLNSGGGFATEGHAIYSALANHAEEITIRVEGIAASAASLIAMAGDVIEMMPGALMMIHDPAGVTFGDAAEHERHASVLNTMGDGYARVYAERAGKDPGEVRELMRAETWFTSAEAVAAGFATRERPAPEGEGEGEGEGAVAAFDFRIYANAPSRLRGLSETKGWRFQSVKRGGPPQNAETTMSVDTGVGGKPVKKEPAAKPDAVAIDAAKAEARQAEKERASGIRALLAKAPLTAEAKSRMEVEMIDGDVSLDQAQKRVLDALCSADEAAPTNSIRVTQDEQDTRMNGMRGALAHAMFGAKLEGPATEYRGLTLKSLAIELSGKPRMGHTEIELVKAGMGARGVLMASGMHSVSDFTYLTTEVMNRALRDAYQSRPSTWRRISSQRTASDFRQLVSVQAGVDATMKKINEAGEYESTIVVDTGEAYKVERFGRELHVTFEAVVNDDMQAFARLPTDFARGCSNLESRIAWGLILANANMADGTTFFHADRNNLAGSGAAISTATVAAGRKAMWEQRPLGAAADGDDFIDVEPDLLFVPPALELT